MEILFDVIKYCSLFYKKLMQKDKLCVIIISRGGGRWKKMSI